ncbi:10094_t:CDS:2 [Funneliformis caledonium]|uniref:10094_t:CDS:1 n=1 Tax=Funneliformis caledonium TaxID=1117310 RepID=A0A9N9I2U4_9GLOM|nr:10094_t:CDS:2 [Funneliformis caledonium]
MVKHTKERLLEHSNIISVSDDGLTAFCKCDQNIKLRYPYNDDYFAEPTNTLPKKRFTCMGLCEQIHRTYTQRVQLTITHGSYPSRHLLAKQFFPEKFSEKVDYSKLNQSELDLLHKEVI